jgi:hypothetical protein
VGGRIVIDHANSNNTVSDFGKIVKLLRAKGLKTVTLNDVWDEPIATAAITPAPVEKDYFFGQAAPSSKRNSH